MFLKKVKSQYQERFEYCLESKKDRLVLTAKNEKLLIQKATSMAKQMEDDFDPLTKLSERTAKKLWDSKYDEIWNNF